MIPVKPLHETNAPFVAARSAPPASQENLQGEISGRPRIDRVSPGTNARADAQANEESNNGGAVPSRRRRAAGETGTWRHDLLQSVTDAVELLRLVDVDPAILGAPASEGLQGFPLRVPHPYIARMRPGDPDDPLLRQVLPSIRETEPAPGYGTDPLHETDAVVDAGVLKKYRGRALVIANGACAVHCRYCFRRHFPYEDHRQDSSFPSVAAIRRDPTIQEVILSGGDPLMLTDPHLARLLAEVGSIGHVARIRIHTRLPVVIPRRVTQALIDMLANLRQRVVIVLHFNHPNEIDADCAAALSPLSRFTLLNQSVLLHGVNDNVAALVGLSERLFDAGVLPYYLHMPDAVAGTAHFDVPERRAVELHRQLMGRLPGYLVPRLVREVPGGAAKELVAATMSDTREPLIKPIRGLDQVARQKRGFVLLHKFNGLRHRIWRHIPVPR